MSEKISQLLNLQLPVSVLKNIVVLFSDGDENNWDIENIDYYFNIPTECPFYPGFYYIPGFSRYAINKEGILIVIKTGYRKKWTITKPGKRNKTGGYYITHGIHDYGQRKDLSRHRAMCLVFKHPGFYVGNHHVNHKDGIPGNDILSNLEWVTPGQNIQHAYDNNLFPTRLVPISTWNWKTNEKKDFPSIVSASKSLELSWDLINGRLLRSNSIKYEDGWRFKYKNQEWLSINKRVGQNVTDVEVIALNVFTGKSFIFDTIVEASSYTKNIIGTICSQIKNETLYPVNGWLYRKFKDFEGWPKYSEKHLQIFKERPTRPGDGIEIYDKEKNETIFFTSYKSAGDFLGLTETGIRGLVREVNRNKFYKNRWLIIPFRLKETIGPPTK